MLTTLHDGAANAESSEDSDDQNIARYKAVNVNEHDHVLDTPRLLNPIELGR